MDAVKNYERWLNQPDLDPALKQEMEQMTEEQINAGVEYLSMMQDNLEVLKKVLK